MDGDTPQPPVPDGNKTQWQYNQDNGLGGFDAATSAVTGDVRVEWTASEFIAHSKGFMWYALLAGGSITVSVGAYLLTRDRLSAGMILFVALLLGIAATRKPRVLKCAIDNDGLTVDQKAYPYSSFRSFAVMDEGAFSSIVFIPLQRFMPPVTVYYDPKDEDRIMGVLSRSIPLENRKHDVIDQIIRKIHF